MRITGGSQRGRLLKTLSGRRLRPTADRVREALFNIRGPRVRDAAVLDLFAGCGSLGLEALSRGAARATFVEKNRRATAIIRRNAEELGLEERATLFSFDVFGSPARLRRLEGPFDVVLIDPPYHLTERVEPDSRPGMLLQSLWTDGVVAADGLVVLEHDRRSVIAREWQHFRVSDTRTYGDTSLTFLEAGEV